MTLRVPDENVDADKIWSEYISGKTGRQIAHDRGLSYFEVRRVLRQNPLYIETVRLRRLAGLRRSNQSRRKSVDLDLAFSMWRGQHRRIRELAALFGVSIRTMHNRLRSHPDYVASSRKRKKPPP